MCPDRQILSVYLDGELPSPWKEKLEKHLEICVRCRERLEAYRKISRLLAEGESLCGAGPAIVPPLAVSAGEASAAAVSGETALTEDAAREGVKERIWDRLQTRGERPFPHSPGIWRRTLSVPVPAAAAAAAVLLMALGALFFRQSFFAGQAQDNVISAGVDIEAQGIVPVADMNRVLQYLGNTDTGDIVILRLPESRNFMSSGEPRIIRAAELPATHPRDFLPRLPGAPVPKDGEFQDIPAYPGESSLPR
jgi:hypothetical protein